MLVAIIVVILIVVGIGVYFLTRPPSTPTNNGIPVSIFDGQNGGSCGAKPQDCGYSPSTLNIKIGVNATVTWTNTGTIPHTVTSNQTADGSLPSFDSGSGGMQHNAQFTYTFTQAGTYHYYCTIHPNYMKAVVVVS